MKSIFRYTFFWRESKRPPPEDMTHVTLVSFIASLTTLVAIAHPPSVVSSNCNHRNLLSQERTFKKYTHPARPLEHYNQAIITLAPSEMALLPDVSSSLVVERSNEKSEVSWLPGNGEKRSFQSSRYVSSV